ncbi:MAG: DUF433 domain-containing protein [Chloroflexota bacterium]
MTGGSASYASIEPGRGVYDAHRAAALAGVPVTTLHYWARNGIYKPSVSPDPRVRQWSWADLLTLRVIDWLRQEKSDGEVPRASVKKIRQALHELDKRGLDRAQLHALCAVSRKGEIFFELPEEGAVRAAPGQQGAWSGVLRLVRPYQSGPDLLNPRPRLRIIPGKLHGEPHVLNTRIPSAAIYALSTSGYSLEQIRELYPAAEPDAVADAIDLERSIDPAARHRAA